MKTFWFTVLACVMSSAASGAAQEVTGAKAYELRIYTASPGKLPELQNLIGSEGLSAFARHGVENVLDATVLEGAPIDGTDANNMLVLILAHKNHHVAEGDWVAVNADRTWTSAWSKAETSGSPLLSKPVSSLYLDTVGELPTSPIQPVASEGASRVFELRKYNTGAERLPNMIAEFKEGIAAILVKAGMTPIIYWRSTDESSCVYLLAHRDREAARTSWAAFIPEFRPFIADFNAHHLPAAAPGSPAPAQTRRTPDDNRFLVPTAFSPLR